MPYSINVYIGVAKHIAKDALMDGYCVNTAEGVFILLGREPTALVYDFIVEEENLFLFEADDVKHHHEKRDDKEKEQHAQGLYCSPGAFFYDEIRLHSVLLRKILVYAYYIIKKWVCQVD